ncbi:hypothetical protein E3E12_07940 [Formicincola oecophyllae]|uniref:Uncharacterized protein n=1 Tax=Formicincola oecophyllae TaxID=2558361 RepID=A0A4Y6UCB5_9PROT|nr:hypothetical protein [Formicincola oecophyllae]QDH14126.1 hypothetical protein E3E12_07940 [Formicincola oecophyllae]
MNRKISVRSVSKFFTALAVMAFFSTAQAQENEKRNCASPIIKSYNSPFGEGETVALVNSSLKGCHLVATVSAYNELGNSPKESLHVISVQKGGWHFHRNPNGYPNLLYGRSDIQFNFMKDRKNHTFMNAMMVHDENNNYDKSENFGLLFSDGVLVQYEYGPNVQGILYMSTPIKIAASEFRKAYPVAIVKGTDASIILPPLDPKMKEDFLNAK